MAGQPIKSLTPAPAPPGTTLGRTVADPNPFSKIRHGQKAAALAMACDGISPNGRGTCRSATCACQGQGLWKWSHVQTQCSKCQPRVSPKEVSLPRLVVKKGAVWIHTNMQLADTDWETT